MIRSMRLSLIVLVSLSGCAVMQYEQPADPAAPSVTFENRSKADVVVVGYKDAAACIEQINISKKSSPHMELPPGESEQIKIRPHEPFSFLISMRELPGECLIAGTLIPNPANSYVTSFYYDHRMCYITVTRLQDGGAVSDSEFVPRVFKMPFTDSFPACMDKLPSR